MSEARLRREIAGRTPWPWFGGKARHASRILPHFPAHSTYCEPFAGAAAMLWAKRRSDIEVLNDLDSGVVTVFRCLRDPDTCERLAEALRLTPYSREEYHECRRTWATAADPIEKARRWLAVAWMSFGGSWGTSWSWDRNTKAHGGQGGQKVQRFCARPEQLRLFMERLRGVQIENRPAPTIIPVFDTPATLFYLDPPYIHDTRPGYKASNTSRYDSEMTDDDHRELVQLVLGLRGTVVLSGYAHPIYEPLESAAWRRIDWDTGACSSASLGRDTKSRTESLWISPRAQSKTQPALF